MKKIIFACLLSFCAVVSAADYAALMKEAKAAAKKKNVPVASEKYQQAYKAAATTGQRYNAIMEYGDFLRFNKKAKEMTALIDTELSKKEYTNSQRQRMLWLQALPYMWGKQHDYALDKFNTAMAMKGAPKSGILYGKIVEYAAKIYDYHKKDYATVIHLLEPQVKLQTTAYMLESLYTMLANAYFKLGKKEEALKNYQQALHYAKKMKKKTASIEKKIKELSDAK